MKQSEESKGIKISIIGSFLFAILGFSFATYSQSQAILLDGTFNFISALMGLGALRICILIKKPYTEELPIGYASFEPLFILIKGLVLFSLTIYILISNVITLINGGHNLSLGPIVIYIAIALTGNIICFSWISAKASKTNSPMLNIERDNWKVNSIITGGIGLAFVFALLFKDSWLKEYIQFIDQVVVITVCLLTVGIPITALKEGLFDLLLIAPPEHTREKIHALIKDRINQTLLKNWSIHVLKTGRKYWITFYYYPVNEYDTLVLNEQLTKQLSESLKPNFPIIEITCVAKRNIK